MEPAVIAALLISLVPVLVLLGKAIRWVVELILARLDKRQPVSPPTPPVADVALTPPDDHADEAIRAWKTTALANAKRIAVLERRAETTQERHDAEVRSLHAQLLACRTELATRPAQEDQ